jgi:hypothetical protein
MDGSFGLSTVAEILDLSIFWGALSNGKGLISIFSAMSGGFLIRGIKKN